LRFDKTKIVESIFQYSEKSANSNESLFNIYKEQSIRSQEF